jgi:hypothetical protein
VMVILVVPGEEAAAKCPGILIPAATYHWEVGQEATARCVPRARCLANLVRAT